MINALEILQKKVEAAWACEAKAVATAEEAKIAEAEMIADALAAEQALKESESLARVTGAERKYAELKAMSAEAAAKMAVASAESAKAAEKAAYAILDDAKALEAQIRADVEIRKEELAFAKAKRDEYIKIANELYGLGQKALAAGNSALAIEYGKKVSQNMVLANEAEKDVQNKEIALQQMDRRLKAQIDNTHANLERAKAIVSMAKEAESRCGRCGCSEGSNSP